MRNLVFTLAFMLIGSFAFANNSIKSDNLEIATSNEKIELKLDLGKINDLSKEKIENYINNFLIDSLNGVDDELDCSVTVTGSVSVGVAEFSIAVTVSGPCSEIRAQGGAIAQDILNQVKSYIKRNF